jgi:PncC family amidohydrolase
MKQVFKILKKRKMTIGVMESCTGGALANSITNIPGASDVFEEGLVTYSDRTKIKHGVDKKIIKKFGVYSQEVAKEMAKKIKGDVGIGVSGELPGNVYFCIRVKLQFKSYEVRVKEQKLRAEMKEEVVKVIEKLILENI